MEIGILCVGKHTNSECLFLLCHSTATINTERKLCDQGRARWLTLVIPALWEAEASRSQGQEIETILVNKVKPRLY